MPELPEVETIVRYLDPSVRGRRLVGATVGAAALYRKGSLSVRRLVGHGVVGVSRVGKNAVFRFDSFGAMVVNLGMTGRFVFLPPGGALGAARCDGGRSALGADRRHVHGRFRFDDGSVLLYSDPRRFGFFYVTRSREVAEELGIGPDPFGADAQYFSRALRSRRAAVKSLLLDQRIVSGLGNIYADETLFAARMDPRRPGNRASGDAGAILRSARRVLERAVLAGGSTVRDYRLPDGSAGGFQRFHAVYGREGKPCVRCGTPIRKIFLSGRGTHFCPSCQR